MNYVDSHDCLNSQATWYFKKDFTLQIKKKQQNNYHFSTVLNFYD